MHSGVAAITQSIHLLNKPAPLTTLNGLRGPLLYSHMYVHLSAVTNSLGRAQPLPGTDRRQLLMRSTDYQCN